MPDNDEQDTEQAPTEQASTETTELPPANHAAATPGAWSLDDTAEVDSDSARGRWLSVGLVGLVVAVAGALIYLAATLFNSHHAKQSGPSVNPSPQSTKMPVAAPPPKTVTVTPPPTVTVTAAPPTPEPTLTSTDQQFLAVLTNQGLTYPNPAYAISHAQAVCDFMATHRGTAASPSAFVENTTAWTGLQAVEFSDYARVNYCPQFASE